MLFGKTFKLLICLVILIPIAIPLPHVSASENYDYEELMEYEGFGQTMYESVMRQSTLLTTRYEDNKEYAGQIIDAVGEHANYVFNEMTTFDSPKEYMKSLGGLTMTVADWVKDFFNKVDEDEQIKDNGIGNYSGYDVAIKWIDQHSHLQVKPGFSVDLYENGQKFRSLYGRNTTNSYFYIWFRTKQYSKKEVEMTGTWGTKVVKSFGTEAEASDYVRETLNQMASSLSGYLTVLSSIGGSVVILRDDTGRPLTNNKFSDVNNSIQRLPIGKQMVTPQPIPYLTCPNDMKIPIDINGSTFMDKQGNIMQVNKDGTAFLNDVSCNLSWSVPQMKLIGDIPVIELPNGDLVDVETREKIGEIEKIPTVPDKDDKDDKDDKNEVDKLDNSLIQYVKNAYEYATNVLKTATDGLKSLAAGAKDITALFGVFFSWLPKEMVVLMSSGLGIMIGLRLFRK